MERILIPFLVGKFQKLKRSVEWAATILFFQFDGIIQIIVRSIRSSYIR